MAEAMKLGSLGVRIAISAGAAALSPAEDS
jgi:hypothetical protein